MKIAIGPIESEYGGLAQHVLNIRRYSNLEIDLIRVPRLLTTWGYLFRNLIIPIASRLPHQLEHSDKRFDMYGWQEKLDAPGWLLRNSLKYRYNLLHLHGHPYWPRLYEGDGSRMVYTVHNLYHESDFPVSWRTTIGMLTDKMIATCRRAHTVIVVAKWLASELHEKFGVASTYIPNGVALEEFISADSSSFIDKYGIEDEFYLFIGRCTQYKRIGNICHLARRFPSRLFILSGLGVTTEGVQAFIREPLPKNVRCIGKLGRKDVVDGLSACRAFILPSARETFGIVVLEAMASGKPVVAANSCGPSEIITNGATGFLFEPDDIDSLANSAESAWHAPDVGLAGLEYVKKYDWKKVVKQIENVYAAVTR